MNKHTPLFEAQKALNAKFTTFGGWELPVSYTSILQEHDTVRTKAGLFDVSHMGEILITGKDALTFVNNLVTNDISPAPFYKAIYSPMCYENGTVVDDIIVYKFSNEELLLVVNAGNIDKDYDWISENKTGNIKIENLSDKFVQLALQGPKAEVVIKKVLDEDIDLPGFFRFKEVNVLGMKVLLSRSGYTGEDGFELYMWLPNTCAQPIRLWQGILEAGKEEGITPVGLGARDTLRLEAALPLYGHELSDKITPLEANLEKFVKFNKGEFIGKKALNSQKTNMKIYGFEMLGRGIARNGYEVVKNGEKLGYVTSGGPLPSLNKNGGLALLDDMELSTGDEIEILIRGRSVKAEIVNTPFYGKKYKK